MTNNHKHYSRIKHIPIWSPSLYFNHHTRKLRPEGGVVEKGNYMTGLCQAAEIFAPLPERVLFFCCSEEAEDSTWVADVVLQALLWRLQSLLVWFPTEPSLGWLATGNHWLLHTVLRGCKDTAIISTAGTPFPLTL